MMNQQYMTNNGWAPQGNNIIKNQTNRFDQISLLFHSVVNPVYSKPQTCKADKVEKLQTDILYNTTTCTKFDFWFFGKPRPEG